MRSSAHKLPIILGMIAISAPAQTWRKIEASALQDSRAYSYLEELSNTIGPRLTGSPEAELAVEWAKIKMQSIGLKNVHLESWPLERGWQRGAAKAQLVSPFHLSLNISAYGWSGSTKTGSRDADVVAVDSNRLLDEAKENSPRWAGKILLLVPAMPTRPMRTNSQMPAFVSAAAAAHALAVIKRDSRPGVMLTHTEPLSFPMKFSGDQQSIAVVDIADEQQKLLEWLLKSGLTARIRMDVENQFSSGPVDCANLVGEIPGSEHPEQIVIVAAHLDSWDLGTGAIDDGFGVAAVIAAAEAIVKSGARPRRTVRFVLFTGEEQGLLGSKAYVEQHRSELSNIVCTFALDWGQGPITGIPLAGHDELAPALSRLAENIDGVQKLQVQPGYLFATDAYSFTLAGVPGLAPFQDSPGYSTNGHSAADTLDKVDPAVLTRNSALLALLSFGLADAPQRPGEFWTPGKTAQALKQGNQQTMLELFGMWPF